ncbi:GyrI-like domain-containing protein [Microbacterium sp. G2-8]|uniref:GyrI-like domain-containing protein n=1 Tax=Microbacterium sp. G2-8 TaxID=2842454 RepID=UPI0027E26383|nr:GyrI-like domain-containing protein [Microbacterium sp. G2-8]
MNDKIDVKKDLATYHARRGRFDVVTVPCLRYLAIDGQGDPNTSSEYAAALSALYPIAYATKFASKRELGLDYVVPPLEGLWWADDMAAFTVARNKTRWNWTMMILVPDWITADAIETARASAQRKDPAGRTQDVTLRTLDEGLCVQTLHVGSFDDEGPVLDALHHQFIPDNDLLLTGTHHEVYLSDPRRTAPHRLRTILRQPVIRA